MKKQTKIILLILLLLAVTAAGIGIGLTLAGGRGAKETASDEAAAQKVDTEAADWEGEKETYTGKKNTDTIDIPGYGSITLQADVKEQKVNFHNPEQNNCYFKMSLSLSDGTKLWESDLIEPGKGIYDITLNEPLKAGEYEDTVLKYECFSMDEAQTPLNGSEVRLVLNVLE